MTRKRRNQRLSEQTVRAIRRAYRPGVRLRKLEEQFQTTGGAIITIANRSTYNEYETKENEYEPPPHIRGTRRREQPATPTRLEQAATPIRRTDIKHLLPEAVRAIREAIDDGEPIARVARSFGLEPEAIAHMERRR